MLLTFYRLLHISNFLVQQYLILLVSHIFLKSNIVNLRLHTYSHWAFVVTSYYTFISAVSDLCLISISSAYCKHRKSLVEYNNDTVK